MKNLTLQAITIFTLLSLMIFVSSEKEILTDKTRATVFW